MRTWIAPTLPTIQERERAVGGNQFHGKTIVFSMTTAGGKERGGTIRYNAWEFDRVENQIMTEYRSWFEGNGTLKKWGVLTEQ
jgi:hypothetical protein